MKKIAIQSLAVTGLMLVTSQTFGAVVTSFDIDLSPAAQSFASAAASTLALNYTIDGSGNIQLDAVALTGAGGDASPARWNQLDNASAGSTTSTDLYNTSLTLTFSGSALPILNYNPTYDNAGTGSILATQEGNQNALEDGEFIAFTVSGTATAVSGFKLDLVDFSYDLRLANGQSSFGVQDTSGTVIEQLIPNTSLSGTIDGTGISLAAGESMTFRTISGNSGGAGLSGFTFNVDTNAIPEPSSFILMMSAMILGFMKLRHRI
jgi:hypothetical protein